MAILLANIPDELDWGIFTRYILMVQNTHSTIGFHRWILAVNVPSLASMAKEAQRENQVNL